MPDNVKSFLSKNAPWIFAALVAIGSGLAQIRDDLLGLAPRVRNLEESTRELCKSVDRIERATVPPEYRGRLDCE